MSVIYSPFVLNIMCFCLIAVRWNIVRFSYWFWLLIGRRLTNPLSSSAFAAAAPEPVERALQCPSRWYPTETAGVCPADPTEPGRQSRTGMASGTGGHRSDPKRPGVRHTARPCSKDHPKPLILYLKNLRFLLIRMVKNLENVWALAMWTQKNHVHYSKRLNGP